MRDDIGRVCSMAGWAIADELKIHLIHRPQPLQASIHVDSEAVGAGLLLFLDAWWLNGIGALIGLGHVFIVQRRRASGALIS